MPTGLEILQQLGIQPPQPQMAPPPDFPQQAAPQAQMQAPVPQPQQPSGIETLFQILAQAQQSPPEPTGKEKIKTALGDFLSTFGEGLSNRGRGRNAGSQAIQQFVPPSVQDRMIRQQQQQAKVKQLMEMIQMRIQQGNMEKQPERNIDPLSQSGIAATIAREAALARLKPPEQRNIDPNSQEGIAAAVARAQALEKIKPPAAPVAGRDIPLPPAVEEQRKRMNANRAMQDGLSPQQFNRVQILSSQFDANPIVKNYATTAQQYETVKGVLDGKLGGPGDLAVVYQFMKGLDPNSVVRESEYETAAKSGNIFSGALARFNGYLKPEGGFLPPQVRQAFFTILQQKLDASEKQVNGMYQDFGRRIDKITGKSGEGTGYLTDYPAVLGSGSATPKPKAGFRIVK